MNLRYISDMASDIKDQKDFQSEYDFFEEKGDYYRVEYISLFQDDQIYDKKKGKYISIEFNDVNHHDAFVSVSHKLTEILKNLASNYHKVLICGLGNSDLACDRLGPLLKNRIIINKIGHTFLLIPGVKGQTGIETFDIIHAYVKESHPDIIILVDALATRSIERMNKVIQITDTGLKPGSGIGNHCVEINQETLGIPVISIGVPTVVKLVNIAIDIINYLGINDLKEFEEKLKDSQFNQVVMDKSCDIQVEKLASLIATSLNAFLDENS